MEGERPSQPHVTLPLVVFDVCDTLYAENTTIGFLKWHYKTRPLRQLILSLLISRVSPIRWGVALVERAVLPELGRMLILQILRGETRDKLEDTADHYVAEALTLNRNEEIHRRLENHLRKGHEVVLVSNSLDVVVAAIAKSFSLQYEASKLAFNGDICLGRTTFNLAGRKHLIVKNLLASSGASRPLYVYTDNRSDLRLLAIADKPYVVIPQKQIDKKWPSNMFERIYL